MPTKKKREEYIISREVQVDGNKSELVIKIVFDTEKGTVAITPRITTKHLSFDEIQKTAVLQQIGDMVKQAYELAMELMESYLESNRPGDRGQMSLFEILQSNGTPEDPEEDTGDGGPDDEVPEEKPAGRRRVKATRDE